MATTEELLWMLDPGTDPARLWQAINDNDLFIEYKSRSKVPLRSFFEDHPFADIYAHDAFDRLRVVHKPNWGIGPMVVPPPTDPDHMVPLINAVVMNPSFPQEHLSHAIGRGNSSGLAMFVPLLYFCHANPSFVITFGDWARFIEGDKHHFWSYFRYQWAMDIDVPSSPARQKKLYPVLLDAFAEVGGLLPDPRLLAVVKTLRQMGDLPPSQSQQKWSNGPLYGIAHQIPATWATPFGNPRVYYKFADTLLRRKTNTWFREILAALEDYLVARDFSFDQQLSAMYRILRRLDDAAGVNYPHLLWSVLEEGPWTPKAAEVPKKARRAKK